MSGQNMEFFSNFNNGSQIEKNIQMSMNSNQQSNSSQDKSQRKSDSINWDQEVENVFMDEIKKFSKQITGF